MTTDNRRKPAKPCATPGCERVAISKGLCRKCYQKQWEKDRQKELNQGGTQQ